MTDTPEWHRSENPWSILLYTLKQDGWRKGKPVMVNDLMIRIENAPGSNHDLGLIADKLLAALTPASAEPVAWQFELARSYDKETGTYFNFGGQQLAFVKPCVPEGSIRNLRPLYAHPAPVTVEAAVEALEALSPFVRLIEVSGLRHCADDTPIFSQGCDGDRRSITVGDFLRAEHALRALSGEAE